MVHTLRRGDGRLFDRRCHDQPTHARDRLVVPLAPRSDDRRVDVGLDARALDRAFARLHGHARVAGLCQECFHRRADLRIGAGHQPRARGNSGADVAHFIGAGLLRGVAIRVVEAVGEVPVEHRRHARAAELRVIAAAFVGIAANIPWLLHAREALRGHALAHGHVEVVDEVTLQRVGVDAACAPLGMRIPRTLPHRARIREALDQKDAASLRDVLAGHVH